VGSTTWNLLTETRQNVYDVGCYVLILTDLEVSITNQLIE